MVIDAACNICKYEFVNLCIILNIMRNILLLLFVLSAAGVSAQVNFAKTTDLNQLLKQAREENKLIFIDAYTDWCGWCKELDKKVFSTQEITDIMNRHYIPVKMEMEQDSIGVMLARKYAIRGFPTAIILNGKGELVNLIGGYSEQPDYAKRMLAAADPAKRIPEGAYSTSFNISYPEFYTGLIPYPEEKEKKKRPDSAAVNTYFAAQQSFSDEQNWVVIQSCYFWLNDVQFNRLLSQQEQVAGRYGKEAYESVVERIVSSKVFRCTQNKDLACAEASLAILDAHVSDSKRKKVFYMENFYENSQMWKELAQHVTGNLKDSAYAANVGNLNERAWTMYEKCDDKAALRQATTWMADVIKVKPTYMFLDTYAALLYKTNRYKEARQYAEMAIDAGHKSGDKVGDTEKLLEKINKASTQKQ
jgi:thioredoxin-related protein